MHNLKIFFLLIFIALFAITGCEESWDNLLSDQEQTENDDDSGTVNSEDFTESLETALDANCTNHEDLTDYIDSNTEAINIVLSQDNTSVNNSGVTVNANTITITNAGVYKISGTLSDGQVVIDTEDQETVWLLLNGVDISNSTTAPLYVENAEKTVILMVDGTENKFSDPSNYVYPDTETDEPNATIFSKDDLTIFGNGSLIVDANYNDAITSKDGLILKNGNITITSVDDGIRGKDYLIIQDGSYNIDAGGDGLKSDNDSDSTKGYIYIESGNFDISADGDAISAETDVLIADGDFNITSGGGSSHSVSSSVSAKGIKGVVNVIINGESFVISSADDAIHSNGNIAVNGGQFSISSGDDGIHADQALTINDGEIDVSKSYEGIESTVITINGGNIYLVASDDGLNVAGGSDGSGNGGWPGGGGPGGGSGSNSNYYLYMNGGFVGIVATGDGVDVNGNITMTGGKIIVHGPTSSANGALDYDLSYKMNGGLLAAAGSSGMAQAPGTNSSQYSLLINFRSTNNAGTIFHIQNSSGANVLTFEPQKRYNSVAFSSSLLTKGETFTVYTGGSSSGTPNLGYYEDGSYTAGTKVTSFTVSSTVTKITI